MLDPHLSAASVAGMGCECSCDLGFGVNLAHLLAVELCATHGAPAESKLGVLVFGVSSEVGLTSLLSSSFPCGPWVLVLSTDLLRSCFLKAKLFSRLSDKAARL